MSYAVAGRVYLGAITMLQDIGGEPTVTPGGLELSSIAGQVVRARPGMRIEVEKDDDNYDTVFVSDRTNYPHVLIPFRGGLRSELQKALEPFRSASFKIERRAQEGLIGLPATGLLVIPDDPAKDDYMYLPAAKLGPESSDLLNWHEVDPISFEQIEFVPTEPTDGNNDMVVGTLAEVAAAIAAANPVVPSP